MRGLHNADDHVLAQLAQCRLQLGNPCRIERIKAGVARLLQLTRDQLNIASQTAQPDFIEPAQNAVEFAGAVGHPGEDVFVVFVLLNQGNTGLQLVAHFLSQSALGHRQLLFQHHRLTARGIDRDLRHREPAQLVLLLRNLLAKLRVACLQRRRCGRRLIPCDLQLAVGLDLRQRRRRGLAHRRRQTRRVCQRVLIERGFG